MFLTGEIHVLVIPPDKVGFGDISEMSFLHTG